MAGKQIGGEGLSDNLAGMTKSQLYDIMSQMKTLIEQNKQQAREILIQNPQLTRALFQAQIMLGMVKPPQVIPNIQPSASKQQPQQLAPPSQQSGAQVSHTAPGGFKDQGVPPVQPPMRKQHQSQLATPASAPPTSLQSQPMPPHQLQTQQQSRGHLASRVNPMSVAQSSQPPNMSLPPRHSVSQPLTLHQPHIPNVSSQFQQPLQTGSTPLMPLQPPMQQAPRGPPLPNYPQQYGNQMMPSSGFQHAGAPRHSSRPMFHSASRPQSSMGSSFNSGQLPHQAGPQSLYQVGSSHLGSEYNQHGSSMQIERGPARISGQPDNSAMSQIPRPSLAHGQMGPSSQPPSPAGAALLTPEMEKTLLQQVMSLTEDQINLLPPEQRNQVLQLQQMLRQ